MYNVTFIYEYIFHSELCFLTKLEIIRAILARIYNKEKNSPTIEQSYQFYYLLR